MVDMMVMVNADVSVKAKMRWMVGGLLRVDMMMMVNAEVLVKAGMRWSCSLKR